MDQVNKPTWLELESIIPLEHRTKTPTAEQITGLSAETIRRRYSNLVSQMSQRRYGIKLKHALAISNNGLK